MADRLLSASTSLPTIIRAEFTDRMAEMGFANIEKYGSTGPNIDCTPAIQNALAAKDGCIVIPPEIYGIGTSIVVPEDAHIMGFAGRDYYSFGTGFARGKSMLRVLAGMTAGTAVMDVRSKRRPTMKNIIIDGQGNNNQNGNVNGISGGSSGMTLTGVYVVGCKNGIGDYGASGGWGSNTTILTATDCTFGDSTKNGVSQLVDSTLVRCELSANKESAVLLAGVASTEFLNCRVEWNGKHGYELVNVDSILIAGGISDAQKGLGAKVSTATAGNRTSKVQFIGHHFRRNGRADTFDYINAHLALACSSGTSLLDVMIANCIFSHMPEDSGTGDDTPTGRAFQTDFSNTATAVKGIQLIGNNFREPIAGAMTASGKIMTIKAGTASPTESLIVNNIGLPDVPYNTSWANYPL